MAEDNSEQVTIDELDDEEKYPSTKAADQSRGRVSRGTGSGTAARPELSPSDIVDGDSQVDAFAGAVSEGESQGASDEEVSEAIPEAAEGEEWSEPRGASDEEVREAIPEVADL